MPHRRRNSDYVHDKYPHAMEFAGDNFESLVRIIRYRDRIKTRNQTKTKIQDVEGNKEKEDDASHSLNRVKPVSRVGIVQIIRSRLDRDHHAIDCVIN